MAKTSKVKRKQTSHPQGLPCTSCNGSIWWGEKYLEITLPSEIKKAICVICEPYVERKGF